MKAKKKKTMVEKLREIRDKISMETMNMTFEELEHYYSERKKKLALKEKTYKTEPSVSLSAEPRVHYKRKK
jgi:hypothetical protein